MARTTKPTKKTGALKKRTPAKKTRKTATKKSATKARALANALVAHASKPLTSFKRPSTWYFPSPNANTVIACDWNAAENRYNLNCREIPITDVPRHVAEAIVIEGHSFG
ncbi:hypothetical protein [Methylocystis sp. Sn-Cys]|uniref:hypothetical protein n=1 Tax=Methylocystis sp. Sn-Cys TaxID=1701263 RepID=UPI0019233F9D|nr:hypothetical protein [Methylocystis sp. Sn-Cys]MBL1256355.1 hypothetical protein [Methylocystis sp. Sn-Cys]